MNNKYFLGSYIILSILSICTTILLVAFKLTKTVTFSWILVLSPFWGFVVLEFVVVSFVFGTYGIKAVIENKKKKRISYNIYG